MGWGLARCILTASRWFWCTTQFGSHRFTSYQVLSHIVSLMLLNISLWITNLIPASQDLTKGKSCDWKSPGGPGRHIEYLYGLALRSLLLLPFSSPWCSHPRRRLSHLLGPAQTHRSFFSATIKHMLSSQSISLRERSLLIPLIAPLSFKPHHLFFGACSLRTGTVFLSFLILPQPPAGSYSFMIS